MRRKNRRILTIDPGTRFMGIAVFDDRTLVYYGVKTIEKQNSQRALMRECRSVIKQLIADFIPETLIYERTLFPNNPTSVVINTLTREIEKTGRRKGLEVIGVAPNTVRKRVCGDGRAGKRDVAYVLVSYYPELKPYLLADKKWKEEFCSNIFDAIALRFTLEE